MDAHWFWGALTIACVAWYSTITVYVAVKGAADIKHMLARLGNAPKNAPDLPDGRDKARPQ
jgi:hypothetical protein